MMGLGSKNFSLSEQITPPPPHMPLFMTPLVPTKLTQNGQTEEVC